MSLASKNSILLFFALLAVPLVGEYLTSTPSNVPDTGFDILLYEPFDFAYLLLALFLFVVVNLKSTKSNQKIRPILNSVIWSFALFVFAFVAVGQLHLKLGGQL